VLDPLRHEVTVVNAGHMPPLLRRSSGEVVAIGEAESGLPLGIDDGVVYGQYTCALEPGNSLTLYTDGITEAMNRHGDLYGHERLWTRLNVAVADVSDLGRGILDDVKRFVGNRSQADDMCLACFGRATLA